MEQTEFQKKIGERIVELRKRRGLTQSQLARAAGKDAQSIYKVEKGEFKASAYYIHQIAKAMGISLKEFWDFEIDAEA